jgi:HSP20 family molecular chaperone IbpA
MTRTTGFGSPFLLGFDHVERLLDHAMKAAQDSYPPYNIEQVGKNGLRLTLAVAGFDVSELSVTIDNAQLVIRGQQSDPVEKNFLHRGIAARQFQRSFVLADGIEVEEAELKNGLLTVDLQQPDPVEGVRQITIRSGDVQGAGDT